MSSPEIDINARIDFVKELLANTDELSAKEEEKLQSHLQNLQAHEEGKGMAEVFSDIDTHASPAELEEGGVTIQERADRIEKVLTNAAGQLSETEQQSLQKHLDDLKTYLEQAG